MNRHRGLLIVAMAAAAVIVVGVMASSASASVPDMLGLGADNVGVGGAVTAEVDDGFAAYYNPAGLTQGRGIRLSLDYVLGQAALEPFSGIVYDRDGNGLSRDVSGGPEYGPVGTDYRDRPEGRAEPFYTSGLQFAAAIPLGKYIAVGVAGFLPKEGAMRLQVEDPQLPYYVMYRNRNNRTTFNPAVSVQPLHDVHIGFGAQVMGATETSVRLAMHTELDAFAATDSGSTESASAEREPTEVHAYVSNQVEHMSSRLVYRATPNVGAIIGLGAFVSEASPAYRVLRRFAVGAAYRGAYGVSTNTDVLVGTSGHVRFDDETVMLTPLLDEPVELQLTEPTAAFNPAQLALGVRGGYGPLDLVADCTWTQWSAFTEMTIPFQRIEVNSLAGTELVLETGRQVPPPAFEDTLSVRVGARFQLGPWPLGKLLQWGKVVARAGYAHIPSPVPEQTGLTNYIDSNRRVLTAGLGVEIGRLPGLTDSPVQLNAAFQHHQLQRRTMTKDATQLRDQDGDGLLDYPHGYPLAGTITSAGNMWAATVGITVAFSGA